MRPLRACKAALELGYRDFERLKKDKALDPIRSDPAYQRLLKQFAK